MTQHDGPTIFTTKNKTQILMSNESNVCTDVDPNQKRPRRYDTLLVLVVFPLTRVEHQDLFWVDTGLGDGNGTKGGDGSPLRSQGKQR